MRNAKLNPFMTPIFMLKHVSDDSSSHDIIGSSACPALMRDLNLMMVLSNRHLDHKNAKIGVQSGRQGVRVVGVVEC